MAASSDGAILKNTTVKFAGKTLIGRCGVTESPWERMIGLLKHSGLSADEALWIAPCTSIHTFFMRFPIDVAFLDKKGKVIAVYDSLPPWRHSWIHPFAAGVLEAKAGVLREAGVRKGEVLELCPTP